MPVPATFTDGYPDSWGAKRVGMLSFYGPSSYAQYTAPTTGGQDVPINGPTGLKAIDKVLGDQGISRSGLYIVQVMQYEAANVRGVNVPRAQIVVKWIVASTGAEAAALADLDAEIVDMICIGPK